MPEFFEKVWAYLLGRADNLTAWIGVTGLALQFLNLQSLMFALFIALLVLPEAQFTSLTRDMTKKIRATEEKRKQ